MHRTVDGAGETAPPSSDEACWTPAVRRAAAIALFRKNLAAAAALILPAAEAGVAAAQYYAGVLCENGGRSLGGLGTGQWYLRAAEQNFSLAQARLGTLYLEGQGVPQNFLEAYTWLSLAAANGTSGAREQRDRAAGHMTEQALAQAQQWTATLWEEHVSPRAPRRGVARQAVDAEPEPPPLLPTPAAPSRPH